MSDAAMLLIDHILAKISRGPRPHATLRVWNAALAHTAPDTGALEETPGGSPQAWRARSSAAPRTLGRPRAADQAFLGSPLAMMTAQRREPDADAIQGATRYSNLLPKSWIC